MCVGDGDCGMGEVMVEVMVEGKEIKTRRRGNKKQPQKL